MGGASNDEFECVVLGLCLFKLSAAAECVGAAAEALRDRENERTPESVSYKTSE